MPYSARYQNPLGCSDRAFGGAGTNLGIEVLSGDTDMIWTFDDFNSVITGETFNDSTNWEPQGWVLTDDPAGSPTSEVISMNDPTNNSNIFDSCIKIYTGTADDRGGNMQLDRVNMTLPTSSADTFPHIWIAPSGAGAAAATALDNTVLVFACRIGLNSGDTTAGNWDSKFFIGWAAAGDTSVMDHDTGVLTDAAGELFGFHVNETGCIDGISKNTAGDSYVSGTTYTRLIGTGGVDGTLANGAETIGDTMWFDLALKMEIADQSGSASNISRFYYRRVPGYPQAPGIRTKQIGGDGGSWQAHATTLSNETPYGAVTHVPTIEAINGPTAGNDATMFVDWWAMGASRYSRRLGETE